MNDSRSGGKRHHQPAPVPQPGRPRRTRLSHWALELRLHHEGLPAWPRDGRLVQQLFVKVDLDYKGTEPGRPKWKSKLRTSGVTGVAYQPCIDDLEHIRAVEGERYVVLRPGTPLSGVHNELQRLLRQRFSPARSLHRVMADYSSLLTVVFGWHADQTRLRCDFTPRFTRQDPCAGNADWILNRKHLEATILRSLHHVQVPRAIRRPAISASRMPCALAHGSVPRLRLVPKDSPCP